MSWVVFSKERADLYVNDIVKFESLSKNRALAVVLDAKRTFFITQNDSQPQGPSTLKEVVLQKKSIYVENDQQLRILYAVVTALGLDPKDVVKSSDKSSAYCQVQYIYLEPTNKKLTFITFDDMDIHKLKTQIPYALTEGIDMNIYYDLKNEKFPVKLCLVFKTIIWTPHQSINKNKEWIRDIINEIGDMDDTAYYTKYFQFAIIEHFDSPFLSPSTNVPGFYDAQLRRLVPENQFIDGVPLEVVGKVILKNQDREEENGEYVYQSPWLVKVSDDEIKSTQEFICFGDETIKNEGLCNSKYDAFGVPKLAQTYWDRPCVTNIECPFYQKNKNYPNYRGGCNNGYCEMPIGITRNAFRLYDKSSSAICHGCPVDTPKCCASQKKPKYAFELD